MASLEMRIDYSNTNHVVEQFVKYDLEIKLARCIVSNNSVCKWSKKHDAMVGTRRQRGGAVVTRRAGSSCLLKTSNEQQDHHRPSFQHPSFKHHRLIVTIIIVIRSHFGSSIAFVAQVLATKPNSFLS